METACRWDMLFRNDLLFKGFWNTVWAPLENCAPYWKMAKGEVFGDNCWWKFFLCLYFYSLNNVVSNSINKFTSLLYPTTQDFQTLKVWWKLLKNFYSQCRLTLSDGTPNQSLNKCRVFTRKYPGISLTGNVQCVMNKFIKLCWGTKLK